MFSAEPSSKFLKETNKAARKHHSKEAAFVIQTITTKNDLLNKKYLDLPEESILKNIYILSEINPIKKKNTDLTKEEILNDLLKKEISRYELVDNYYGMLFTAIGNKNKPFDLSGINFELDNYQLKDDIEKGIFFLRCMSYCGKEIWGFINIAQPPNTKKALSYIEKYPSINNRPYHEFSDVYFKDFEMIIDKEKGKQSYKSYYLNKYFETLLNHVICLSEEGAEKEEIQDLLLSSILKESDLYQYTEHKDMLLGIFQPLERETPKEPNAIQIDKAFYEAVDKWVILPSDDNSFTYGCVYIDEQAGFTFHWGGQLVYEDGKYSIDEKKQEETDKYSTKIRIDQEWKANVGIIPNDILKQVGLPNEPEWLEVYKSNAHTVAYKTKIGYFFNHVGGSQQAIPYLEEAYRKEPHFEGLEFELGYAYNATKQYEKAIEIMNSAIENNPKNYYFYRELGFSFKYLNKVDEAEKIYKKGIGMSDNDFEKSEMALNMAHTFFELGNKKKFKEWAEITKKYAEVNSRYAKLIELFESKFEEKK